MDSAVGEILEGEADGLFEEGNAVGTSVTGYVGSEDSKNVGVLLGVRDGVVVGTAVTGKVGATEGSKLGQ